MLGLYILIIRVLTPSFYLLYVMLTIGNKARVNLY